MFWMQFQQIVIAERFRFYKWDQKTGESEPTLPFAHLAPFCKRHLEFEVCRMRQYKEDKVILYEADLTHSRVFEIAQEGVLN